MRTKHQSQKQYQKQGGGGSEFLALFLAACMGIFLIGLICAFGAALEDSSMGWTVPFCLCGFNVVLLLVIGLGSMFGSPDSRHPVSDIIGKLLTFLLLFVPMLLLSLWMMMKFLIGALKR